MKLNTVCDIFSCFDFCKIVCLVSNVNRPKLCSNATWAQTGITFADQSMVGNENLALFVDTSNYIYSIDQPRKVIQVWKENSSNHIKTIPITILDSWTIFVTHTQHIYFDNGSNKRIQTIPKNSSTSQPVIDVSGPYTGLFIDHMNQIYFSVLLHDVHTISPSPSPSRTSTNLHTDIRNALAVMGYPVIEEEAQEANESSIQRQ